MNSRIKLDKLKLKIIESKQFQTNTTLDGIHYMFDDFYIVTVNNNTKAHVIFQGVVVMELDKSHITNSLAERQKKLEDMFFDCGGM